MASQGIMSPEHPRWTEFQDRLSGSDGIRLRSYHDGAVDWDCDNSTSRPKTTKILMQMGFHPREVMDSLELFLTYDGFCDCSVVFNVEEQFQVRRETKEAEARDRT